MKIKNALILAVTLIVAACNNGEDGSDAYGNFEATDKLISSEVSGRVIQLAVEEGQELKEGDLIALIDTTQLVIKRNQLIASRKASQSKTDQVKASIEVLKAQKGVLMKDVTRVYNMYREKAATSKQVDDLQGQVHVMEKQLEGYYTQIESIKAELGVIDAQLAEIEDQLHRCNLMMPSEGTVLQKFVEQGEMAVMGKPVVKVADLNTMFLRAFVTGSQLPEIQIGQKVEVRFDKTEDTNQTIEGTISWISSSAEFTPKIVQTKEERVDLVYAVKIAIENDGRVKIGMPGEVKF
ncbi:HlyD family secretion protein [Carboxylicivirga caseinilyticus]|uniref:HlyD family secretion protein n=1 Tax=Carboxylicivirga caseinilyticus TaxID=3417572 RepID=UPI003D32FB32|nr:efflux RND transporter periplasmic adaptor subunit [Marinilabiliaceae bacterium A049]